MSDAPAPYVTFEIGGFKVRCAALPHGDRDIHPDDIDCLVIQAFPLSTEAERLRFMDWLRGDNV